MNQTLARLNPIRRGQGEHTHGFTQLLFGLGGVVRCEMDDGAFDVSVENIGVVPRGAPHYFAGRSDDSRLLVVDLYLDDDMIRQMQALDAGVTFDDMFTQPRAFAAPRPLRPMIGCAAAQLGQSSSQTRLLSHQWATMFAVQVYRLLDDLGRAVVDTREARFYELIDARRGWPPSNLEIQRHLGISGSALNQWSRQRYGLTPQQVVLQRRLTWARDRLIDSEQSIGRIAHEAGFADAPTFTRAFRRVYATTPAVARRAGDTRDRS